jgi:WD40 repeat protein/DNA-binding SARP family transcriptional activator/DNA-binding XRE family transcriptional regulator
MRARFCEKVHVAGDRDGAKVASGRAVAGPAGRRPRDEGAGAGLLVRIRRQAAGLTQQELASLAGVSVGTVRDLEQGRTHRPGRDLVSKLAGVLGLDAARLQALANGVREPAEHRGGRVQASGLQLKVLGPVEAWRDGARVGLGEPRQRAVLALLALSPDGRVHREALIDAVWPDDPPAGAVQVVQTYVSRLRRVLDPGRPGRDRQGLLVSDGACYRLCAGASQLDLLAFERLAGRARAAALAGEHDAACDVFELALRLWRGDPAADVDALRSHPAVARVSRMRAAAVLEYAELAGQAGHPDRVLDHLADLAAGEPLNEKVCAQLMLTLAAAGQQAAALHAYEDLRLRLDEQLGVLPGPGLAQAHLRVLRQEVAPAGAKTAAGRTGQSLTETGQSAPGGSASPRVLAAVSLAGEPSQLAELHPAGEAVNTAMSAASVYPPADTWVAAVHASEDDVDPIAAAVLVDASRALTCADVAVLGDGALREPLWVSFPKVDGWPRRRVASVTVAPLSSGADLAVLVLQQPAPPEVQAAPVRCPKPADLAGRAWWAFGFPGRDPVGDAAHGVVGAALALGWVRLESASDCLVRPGFSGAGLWSPDYQAVVAVVGRARDSGEARAITLHQADLCLPGHQLARLARWSAQAAGEAAVQQWGWSLARDPEGVRHWRPRAREVSIDSERGYRFRGRAAALSQITGWLDRPEPDRRVLVVTGSPGVGKSAVLGRIVTTADTAIRASVPPGDQAVRAGVGSVSCAVHAKAKTALEVAQEIARAASARLPEDAGDLAPAIRDVLEERGGPRFNVIIDALDEAASPGQARAIIDKVVLALAETCSDAGAQVVVGTRRRDDGGDLLGRFGGALAAVDLDDPKNFAEQDLAAYALACLQLAGDERPGNPYHDDTAAAPLASKIAAMAGRNFLVAGLIARSHGLHDRHAADPGQLSLPATVGSALAAYLERLHPVAGVSASQIMTGLAFAEAPGLPVSLWQLAIEAVDGTRISAEDLTRFARSSAANFLVEASSEPAGPGHGPGITVYRLFHQALNDALLHARSEVMPRADDERALTLAFTRHGRQGRWHNAPPYLLRSLPGHAAAAGLADDLLCDDAYLLHADLRRLIHAADGAGSAQARRRARLLRLTLCPIAADPRDRAALFSVTEVLDDLGTSYRNGNWNAPYQAQWASVTPRRFVASREGHGSHQCAKMQGHGVPVAGICQVTVAGKQLLAVVNDDCTVRILDPFTGQQRTALQGHQAPRIKRGGLWLTVAGEQLEARGGRDGTVRLCDASTGEQRMALEGHRGEVNDVCPVIVAGKQLLASAGDDGTVRIWDPCTGQQRAVLEGHQGGVWSVCVPTVAGQQLLASGGSDGTVRIWDPASGQQRTVLEGHRGEVNDVCAVPVAGKQLLASAGDDGTVRVWDPHSGEQRAVLEGHQGGVWSVCAIRVAGQQRLLASGGSDGTVRIWDPSTGEQRTRLECHRDWVNDVCPVTVAGKQLLASGGGDGMVRVWDPQTGEQRATLEGHHSRVWSVCAVTVARKQLLASGGDDGMVRVWGPQTGEQRATLEGHQGWVNHVCAVTVAGKQLLASAGSDATVRVWNPETGQHQRTTLVGHHGGVRCVCPLTVAGEQLLASGGQDGTVRIWDPQTGEQRTILEGHRGEINGVCPVTVAGKQLLASAGQDGTVRVWDPETGACQLTIPTPYPAEAVAPVAESLAIALSAGILVIKPRTAR